MEHFFKAALLQVALSESHLGKALEEAAHLREEITNLTKDTTTKQNTNLRDKQLELNKESTERLEKISLRT